MIVLFSGGRRLETGADRRVCANPALLGEATLRNFELFKPLISAINGLAIGGGMESLQGIDIRIASKAAWFGQQEVKWACSPRGGNGARAAAGTLLQGHGNYAHRELIDAEEALRIGFINRIVPHDQLMAEAEKQPSASPGTALFASVPSRSRS